MHTFFSYTHHSAALVDQVQRQLGRSLGEIFAFVEVPHADQDFRSLINERLAKSENLVVFLRSELGTYQADEVRLFRSWLGRDKAKREDGSEVDRKLVFICLSEKQNVDHHFAAGGDLMDCRGYQRFEDYE